MNAKTSKTLRRGAAALAIIATCGHASQLAPEHQARYASRTARAIYRRLKAKWKGIPAPKRNRFRRWVKHTTMQVDHGKAKAVR